MRGLLTLIFRRVLRRAASLCAWSSDVRSSDLSSHAAPRCFALCVVFGLEVKVFVSDFFRLLAMISKLLGRT